MKAQKSNYVSATAIVIENRNNGLRNRKLDFTRYALCTVFLLNLASSHSKMNINSDNSNTADDTGNRREQIHLHGITAVRCISKWLLLFIGLLRRSAAVAEILKGNPKYMGASPIQCHANFFSGCGFTVGLGKPKLCTKFEVPSFSHCVNIEVEPQNLGSSPRPRPCSLFLWL